jgi:DNA/RNA endonuclease YhcR with UshA esterase domain
MRERTFLIVAVIWSLIGLFILIILASFTEPPKLNISELENQIGKIVELDAVNVVSVSYKEDTVFLTLEDSTGKISAVYFENPKYEIIENDTIAVKGKVQLYKGDLEIIIEELACLSCP